MQILVLCTANLCRSPMAAALLARHLRAYEVEAHVSTAGSGPGGVLAPPRVVAAIAALGIDLSLHRSCTMTAGMVREADIVIGLAREHVRDALALDPDASDRAFTLKELVRRAEAVGPRAPGEDLAGWLAQLGAGRSAADRLGASSADDVADPIGGPARGYRRTAEELDDLTARLAGLLASGS